jgi:hypothetical protein
MTSTPPTAKDLLEALFAELEINTSRWTYASTPALRAVVVPHEGNDGLYKIAVHIQPNQRDVPGDIVGAPVRIRLTGEIADTKSAVTATINHGGRVMFSGLIPARYRLEVAKPGECRSREKRRRLEPARSRLEVVTPLRQQRRVILQLVAQNPELPLAASDDEDGREVLRWESAQEALSGHVVVQSNGDLTFRVWSQDLTQLGKRVVLHLGSRLREEVLRQVSATEVGAEIVVPRSQRPSDLREISFELVV